MSPKEISISSGKVMGFEVAEREMGGHKALRGATKVLESSCVSV